MSSVTNIPGAEAGPNSGPTTYGVAQAHEADAFGFKWDWAGRSSQAHPLRLVERGRVLS